MVVLMLQCYNSQLQVISRWGTTDGWMTFREGFVSLLCFAVCWDSMMYVRSCTLQFLGTNSEIKVKVFTRIYWNWWQSMAIHLKWGLCTTVLALNSYNWLVTPFKWYLPLDAGVIDVPMAKIVEGFQCRFSDRSTLIFSPAFKGPRARSLWYHQGWLGVGAATPCKMSLHFFLV